MRVLLNITLLLMSHMTAADDSEPLTSAQAGRIFLENAQNFTDESTETSMALAGKTFTVDFAGGNFRMAHQFHKDGKTISWEALSGNEKGNTGTNPYKAYDVRPGITLVLMQPQDYESVLLIIDENHGRAVGFLSRSHADDPDEMVKLHTIQGPIVESGKPFVPYEPADFSDTRFTVVYPGEVAVYEHIYLNEHYLTWLGHKGTSAGVADTERYHAYEIAPLVYILAWNEYSAPLQISLFFDFENKKETGLIFGYDEKGQRNVFVQTTAEITEVAHSGIPGLN